MFLIYNLLSALIRIGLIHKIFASFKKHRDDLFFNFTFFKKNN